MRQPQNMEILFKAYLQTEARLIYGPTTRYPMLKIVKLGNFRASLTHLLDFFLLR